MAFQVVSRAKITVGNLMIVAAEYIPAYSVVTVSGEIADSSNYNHFGKVVGIALNTVSPGAEVVVCYNGLMNSPDWTWNHNSVLFLNGKNLSFTAPLVGWNQIIGVSSGTKGMVVNVTLPILL